MDLQKKAQDFLYLNSSDECLITSDGQIFLVANESFARSHARKVGDNKVLKVKKAVAKPAKKTEEPKAEKKSKSAKSKD